MATASWTTSSGWKYVLWTFIKDGRFNVEIREYATGHLAVVEGSRHTWEKVQNEWSGITPRRYIEDFLKNWQCPEDEFERFFEAFDKP